jgi:hypothetical protein
MLSRVARVPYVCRHASRLPLHCMLLLILARQSLANFSLATSVARGGRMRANPWLIIIAERSFPIVTSTNHRTNVTE